MSQEELDELEASIKPHQRAARREGRPALGAGAVYPVDEDVIFVDPFPIPDHWEQAAALDPGWKVTAGLRGVRDPETGAVYIINEYYGKEAQAVVHAVGLKAMEPWPLTWAMDPAGRQTTQDGKKMMVEYKKLGLDVTPANNAVEAGIMACLTAYQTGLLKVFNTLTYFRKELRLYRREVQSGPTGERSVIVKAQDHLMDCKRYLLNTKSIWRRKPIPTRASGGYGEF